MIGYLHEHTRPDRDNYVTVKWDNIKKGQSFSTFRESVVRIPSALSIELLFSLALLFMNP